MFFWVTVLKGQGPDISKTIPARSIKTDVDREYTLEPGEQMADKIRRNLFIRVKLNRSACYIHEPVLATYTLYSRLVSDYTVSRQPMLNGFSVYNMMGTGVQQPGSVEMVGGKPFTTRILYKVQLIPLQEGDLELDPIEIVNNIQFIKKTAATLKEGSNLDDLMNQLQKEETAPKIQHSYTLQSRPVILRVKSLPPAKDSGYFTGGVGHYSIQTSLDTGYINANDAPVLKLVIKGWGNLPYIDAPVIPWPAGIESYDVRTEEMLDRKTMPLSGSKTFLYAFTSKLPGNYTLPSVRFSWFDVVSNQYKTVQSEPYSLVVKALPPKADSNVSATLTNQPAGAAIKASMPVSERTLRWHLNWLIPVLLVGGAAIYMWRRMKKKKEVVANKEDVIVENDPLEPARAMLANNDHPQFYVEITSVLWRTVAETYSIAHSDLTKQTVAEHLHRQNWNEAATRQFLDLITECEMNLYMPGYHSTAPEALLNRSADMIALLKKRTVSN